MIRLQKFDRNSTHAPLEREKQAILFSRFPKHGATVHKTLHKTFNSATWSSRSLFLSINARQVLSRRCFAPAESHYYRRSARRKALGEKIVAIIDDGMIK